MKRIVLVHRKGRLAGLLQIIGTDQQLQENLHMAELPMLVEPVNFGDHHGAASLIKVTPRYVLYIETMKPHAEDDTTFHPAQQ